MPKAGFAICETTAVGGESVRAYVPPPLPPVPPLRPDRLYGVLEAANQMLGRLDSVRSIVPDTPLFLYMYVRKEALLSSQIEGTQSSLSDRLLFESDEVPRVPLDDVEEVSNFAGMGPASLCIVGRCVQRPPCPPVSRVRWPRARLAFLPDGLGSGTASAAPARQGRRKTGPAHREPVPALPR